MTEICVTRLGKKYIVVVDGISVFRIIPEKVNAAGEVIRKERRMKLRLGTPRWTEMRNQGIRFYKERQNV